MSNNIIISLCIATFNATETFYNKILNILNCTDHRVQIVISDNCSTNNTIDLLETIQDNRLKINKNSKNEGPTYNYVKALSLAEGKFAIFITDKDNIIFKNIMNIVNFLEKESYNLGYFVLDTNRISPKISIYNTPESCINKLGYLHKHPTGYFYNTQLMKNINIMERFSYINDVGFFPFEFICAELAMFGNGAIIDYNLFHTEKLKLNKESRSKTYSKKNNNLFFEPQNLCEQYKKYIKHLNTLKIKNKYYIYIKLLKRLITLSTKTYQQILSKPEICKHYQVDSKILNNNQLIQILEMIKFDINKTNFSILEKFIASIVININIFLLIKER